MTSSSSFSTALSPQIESNLTPDGNGELEQGGLAHFADGSTKHVDVIILCTGYVHHFPFLDDSLRLNPHQGDPRQPKNKIWLKGLYRGIFWMPNPKLIHIGPHTGFFTFSLFDAQVSWVWRVGWLRGLRGLSGPVKSLLCQVPTYRTPDHHAHIPWATTPASMTPPPPNT